MKLTEWFPGDVKPVRVGVYERNALFYLNYSYWDGSVWGQLRGTPTDAWLDRRKASLWQNFEWRGVKK